MSYHRKQIQAPRLSGASLRLFAGLVTGPLGGPVRKQLLTQANVGALMASLTDASPLPPPLVGGPAATPSAPTDPLAAAAAVAPGPQHGFAFETIADFRAAYAGGASPVDVAEAVLTACAAVDEGERPLRALIAQDADDVRRQAAASAARWKAGQPLSVLDGVPVAVKDEVDQVPYPTTVGTKFLATGPVASDATSVAKLRAAGALLVGKANMHEIGIGVTGLNPHHGVCRNPYDPGRHTGGSSSGPAAAVAAGLCPVALAADGGGSIRMPAALCGMVGLKPTYGRVSEHGAAPLTWSLGHLGPIGATARDAAAAYLVMSGPDAHDRQTLAQPPAHVEGFDRDLTGVKLGIYRPWFEDADADVVAGCLSMLDRLREAGATLVDVSLPDLEVMRVAHLVIITSEMSASQRRYLAKHGKDYGYDVQINLALGGEFSGAHYVHAQRQRTRFIELTGAMLADVDVMVTPTTGCVAPRIPETALPGGETNLVLLDRIMRFAHLGNLTGFPAISFPAGYDADGLPIGFQALGRPWEEHLLLRIARVAGELVERRRPAVWRSLLSSASSGA